MNSEDQVEVKVPRALLDTLIAAAEGAAFDLSIRNKINTYEQARLHTINMALREALAYKKEK